MERIDVLKLREVIRDLNAHRIDGALYLADKPRDPTADEWKDPKIYGPLCQARWTYMDKYSVHRANVLYSMAAEVHGRLHIKKKWEPTYAADGGVKLVVKTREDQLKLIGDAWKEFRLVDTATARTPELIPELAAAVANNDDVLLAPELPPVPAVLPPHL